MAIGASVMKFRHGSNGLDGLYRLHNCNRSLQATRHLISTVQTVKIA